MTEGLPGETDMSTQGNQLTDILRRLADASGEQTPSPHTDDGFHINAEVYPHMAEAAERIAHELQLCEGQQRMVEATAVAASVLWPNAHGDQDVHLLDSRLERYRSAVDPEIYIKNFQELEEALTEARHGYLHTFWQATHEGLIVPSLQATQMEFLAPLIKDALTDPQRFHNVMTQSILPLFAAQAQKQVPQSAEAYLALRRAVEANAAGWMLDPFTVKGRTPTEVKQIIGWDNTELDLLSAVDPFDGYEDETLKSYPYVSFMPRIVGGRNGGRAIIELGTRNPIPKI